MKASIVRAGSTAAAFVTSAAEAAATVDAAVAVEVFPLTSFSRCVFGR